MSKYQGIDERDIKCCCKEEDCRQAGISFEENRLRFHFLEYIDVGDKKILDQKTRSMVLNKQTAQALIKELQKI
jgi:hypothetical protein